MTPARNRRPYARVHSPRRPTRAHLCLERLEGRDLLTAGVLDPAFGTNGVARVSMDGSMLDTALAVTTQADGKLVVVGRSSAATTGADFSLARYNADGSLDITFGTAGRVVTDFAGREDEARAVVVEPDGKIVVAGASAPTGTTVHNTPAGSEIALARYNADGTLDTTFGQGGRVLTDGGGTGPVYAANSILVKPDGTVVIAGAGRNQNVQQFVNYAVAARYAIDGSLDPAFGTGGLARVPDGAATAAVRQADGALVLLTGNGDLIRLHPDGSEDTGFGGGTRPQVPVGNGGTATDLALQPDGKLVALGNYWLYPNPSTQQGYAYLVSRVNPDGSPDTTFGKTGTITAYNVNLLTLTSNDLRLQADGKIVAGATGHGDGGSFFVALRLNTDGSVDTSYGDRGWVLSQPTKRAAAYGLTLLDGQAVEVGTTDSVYGGDYALARYTTAGTIDPAFGTAGFVTTNVIGPSAVQAARVAVQADGKVVELGTFPGPNQNTDLALVRLNPDGTLDTTFGTNGRVGTDLAGDYDLAQVLLVQPDQKIVAVGLANPSAAAGGAYTDYALVRYNPDGSPDTTFGQGGKVLIHLDTQPYRLAAALQADPVGGAIKILVAGNFLRRYNADGTPDLTFGTAGQAPAHQMDFAFGLAVQPDGKIVEGGVGSGGVFAVARYTPNGLVDTPFGQGGLVRVPTPPGGDPSGSGANAVAVQPDGKLVATGYFSTNPAWGGHQGLALVRLNADGSFDTGFGAGGIAPTNLNNTAPGTGLVVQPDGRIVVVDLVLRRFNPHGSADTTFGDVGKALPLGFFANVDVALQGDKLVTAGTNSYQNPPGFVVARYTTQATPNEYYVAQLYADLLRRPADRAGLDSWAAQLDGGTPRADVARAFVTSPEYHRALVSQFYASYLHRPADNQGLAANAAFLDAGATIEQSKARFIGSPEYFQTRAHGDTNAFLDALYQDVLGRPADPTGRQAYGTALAAGTPREAVAFTVLTGREAYQNLVGGLYMQFLRRPADPGGLQTFTDALQHGARDEAVIIALVESDEYFNRAGV